VRKALTAWMRPPPQLRDRRSAVVDLRERGSKPIGGVSGTVKSRLPKLGVFEDFAGFVGDDGEDGFPDVHLSIKLHG